MQDAPRKVQLVPENQDSPEAEQPATLPEIVDRVIETAEAETVSLDTLLKSFGRASFTPILLLPALAVATPLSGIPLFSSLMGLIIALVAVQMLLQRRYLWLPQWVLRRQVSGEKVRKAFSRLRRVAGWIDAHTRARGRVLLRKPLIFVPQTLCLVSGLIMPPLEFVPFSSSVLGIGVAILALAMLTRDGLLLIMGLLPYAGVALLVMRVL